MSIAAKLYNRLLLDRIRGPVESKLLNTQAGFRPGRSCTEHIHVLRHVVEGCKYKNLPLVATFIDFRKAFDSINRRQMLKILRHYGVPESIVQAISVLYCNSKSTVIVDGMLSDLFDVITGVLQGDVLAPFIFIIIMDWVLRQSNIDDIGFTMIPRRSRRYPEETLSNLGFADDVSLLSNSVKNAQDQLDRVTQVAAEVGLIINPKKTKVLAVNILDPRVLLNNIELEVVTDFQYLGSYIACADHDMKCRKGKAWSAFWLLQRVWSSNTPIQMKMKIFKASVLSVFLYGSETWVISPQMLETINAFQTACLRIILDISHEDRVTNNIVYSRTNMYPLSYTIQERQLKFLGHSLRRPADHIVSMYGLYCPPHGRPSRGQPPTLYPKYISKILHPTFPITTEEIRRAACDRPGWRSQVVAACRRQLPG